MRSIKHAGTIALALTLTLSLLLGGCTSLESGGSGSTPTPTQMADSSDYEFVFTGASSEFAGGRTMNVSIYGLKDEDRTLELRVAEFPQILIQGCYVFVEGKGYKLYFEDASEVFVYTQYRTDDSTFHFKYTLDMGSTLGSVRMAFSCRDDGFAAEYDGEGLGRTPPTFFGQDVNLVCREDGTCTSDKRTGTWEYDEANNQYLFHFDPDPNYNTVFELNEADAQGRYCGYNKVTDGSTSGERQCTWMTGADPICFELPITKERGVAENEPYKSATTYDPETGRGEIRVASLPNLEELVSELFRGNDIDDYKDLPNICYYVLSDGSLNFLPECATTYDSATGDYHLIWAYSPAKYSITTGTYNPEA